MASNVYTESFSIKFPRERLEFDASNLIYPIYDASAPPVNIPDLPPQGHTQLILPSKVRPLVQQLEPLLNEVIFCYSDRTPEYEPFTGFFVAPTLVLSLRRNLQDSHRVESWMARCTTLSNLPGGYRQNIRSNKNLFFTLGEPSTREKFNSKDFIVRKVLTDSFFPADKKSYLIPSVAQPKVGEYFFTVQFHAQLTETELYQYKKIAPTFLEAGTVHASELVQANKRSVSAGTVREVLDHRVYYACSSSFGSGGAPGFCEGDMHRFCAIHLGSGFDKNKQFTTESNRGILVSDPAFLAVYEKLVLPELLQHGPLDPRVLEFCQFHNINTKETI